MVTAVAPRVRLDSSRRRERTSPGDVPVSEPLRCTCASTATTLRPGSSLATSCAHQPVAGANVATAPPPLTPPPPALRAPRPAQAGQLFGPLVRPPARGRRERRDRLAPAHAAAPCHPRAREAATSCATRARSVDTAGLASSAGLCTTP